MRQEEILKVMQQLRKISDKWLTIEEIRAYMKNNRIIPPQDLHTKLLNLSEFKIIECQGIGLYNHYFIFRGKNE
jgi:hypothetical protein